MWNREVFGIFLFCCCLANSAFGKGVEITPVSGYAIEGEFEDEESGQTLKVSDNALYGAVIDFDVDGNSNEQIELYVTRQETRLVGGNIPSDDSAFNLKIDYFHIGGVLMGGASESKFKPFIVGTIGATHMDPKPSGYDSFTGFSLGLGAGFKYFVTKHVGLRAEARAIGTLVNSDSAIFSGSGGTSVYIRSDLFYQFHFNTGLIFRF